MVAVVAAYYAVLVPWRIHQHSVLWFAHVGSFFLHHAHSSPAIDRVHQSVSHYGYDGQFYFYIAADPSHAADYLDAPGVRYARVLYPMVARAAGGGSTAAVPYAMLAVNVAAVVAGTLALAIWLTRHGRSPWLAALYGLWPGLSLSLFRDLVEPLAYCLVAVAILVFSTERRGRLVVSCALLACALLTRETTLVFPLVLAGVVAVRDRSWRRPAAFAVGALAPVVVWRIVVTQWLDSSTLEPAGGWKVLAPLYGMRAWWPWDETHWLMALTVDLPFLLLAACALVLVRRGAANWGVVLLLANVALFVVFIPRTVTIDYAAAGRNAIPALLAALYAAPAVRSRAALAAAAVVLSPVWFIAVASALGLRWLDYVSL